MLKSGAVVELKRCPNSQYKVLWFDDRKIELKSFLTGYRSTIDRVDFDKRYIVLEIVY